MVILELTYPGQICERRETANQSANDKDAHSQREDLTIFLRLLGIKKSNQ